MREPFRFKLLGVLPPKLLEETLAEALELGSWVVNPSSVLKTPLRKSCPLRISDEYPKSGIAPASMRRSLYYTAAWHRAPKCQEVIKRLMEERGWTELGIATVSVTERGGQILPHVDGGAYFDEMHRVQVSLQAGPGIQLVCEDERVEMKAGEVWCFDNKRLHWVENNGYVSRVNLFFDAI